MPYIIWQTILIAAFNQKGKFVVLVYQTRGMNFDFWHIDEPSVIRVLCRNQLEQASATASGPKIQTTLRPHSYFELPTTTRDIL